MYRTQVLNLKQLTRIQKCSILSGMNYGQKNTFKPQK